MLYKSLNGVQSYIQTRWSQQHITISKCINEVTPAMGMVGTTYTLQNKEVGKEPLLAQAQFAGQPGVISS